MALSENDIEIIEKYLDQDLSPEELVIFETKLSVPEFVAELELQKTALVALKAKDKASLKEELKQLHLKVKENQETPSPKSFSIKYWAAAAVFLLFAVAIGFYLNQQRSTQELYMAYYQPYPADPMIRGSDTNLFNEAMNAYRSKNYPNSIQKFEETLQQHQDSVRLHLFLGNSYLNQGQFELAEKSFKVAAQSQDVFIKQHAQWYLALTYLKDKETASAIETLNRLVVVQGIYKKEAQLLLEELD